MFDINDSSNLKLNFMERKIQFSSINAASQNLFVKIIDKMNLNEDKTIPYVYSQLKGNNKQYYI